MLTSNAKRVGQAPRPEVSHKQGMPTIDAYLRTQKEREEQPPTLAVLPVVATKGTRSDPSFPPSHPEITQSIMSISGAMTVNENLKGRWRQLPQMSANS